MEGVGQCETEVVPIGVLVTEEKPVLLSLLDERLLRDGMSVLLGKTLTDDRELAENTGTVGVTVVLTDAEVDEVRDGVDDADREESVEGLAACVTVAVADPQVVIVAAAVTVGDIDVVTVNEDIDEKDDDSVAEE